VGTWRCRGGILETSQQEVKGFIEFWLQLNQWGVKSGKKPEGWSQKVPGSQQLTDSASCPMSSLHRQRCQQPMKSFHISICGVEGGIRGLG
jgi:hypothetical protein